MSLITLSIVTLLLILIVYLSAQIRLVRGEFVDESGCPVPDWIGFIRAARNSQEQNLEAVSDLPGGQVNFLSLLFFPPRTYQPFRPVSDLFSHHLLGHLN